MDTQIRISVTAELRNHIRYLKNGSSWRALKDEIPGWRWSYAMLADLANGRQKLTNLAVYEVLGLSLPTTVLIMLPEEWKRHSMKCSVCGASCPRWSASQKYCPAHSWQTPEGRRWQRERRAEARI